MSGTDSEDTSSFRPVKIVQEAVYSYQIEWIDDDDKDALLDITWLDKKSKHITDALISTWIDSRTSRTNVLQYKYPRIQSTAILSSPTSSSNINAKALVSNDKNNKEFSSPTSPKSPTKSRSNSFDYLTPCPSTPGAYLSESESELVTPLLISTSKFSGSKLDYSATYDTEYVNSSLMDTEEFEMLDDMEVIKVEIKSEMEDDLCSFTSQQLKMETYSILKEKEWKSRFRSWIEQEKAMEARKYELKNLPAEDPSTFSSSPTASLTLPSSPTLPPSSISTEDIDMIELEPAESINSVQLTSSQQELKHFYF